MKSVIKHAVFYNAWESRARTVPLVLPVNAEKKPSDRRQILSHDRDRCFQHPSHRASCLEKSLNFKRTKLETKFQVMVFNGQSIDV